MGANNGMLAGAGGGALEGVASTSQKTDELGGTFGGVFRVVSDPARGERWQPTGGRKDEGDC